MNTCAKFHQNRLKTVASRPELTSRHPTKELFPYLVESELSLASLAQSITVYLWSGIPHFTLLDSKLKVLVPLYYGLN